MASKMIDWNDYAPTKKSGYINDLSGFTPAAKANLVLADLAPGGLLPPGTATAFLVQAVIGSKFLTFINTDTYDVPSFNVPSAQFLGRVLHAGTEGQAVTAAQRSKPTFSQEVLTFKLAKGQVRINWGVLENNVERSALNNTIMGMVDQKVSADIEDLVVNGDTASTDPYLALTDGLLKRLTSHVVIGDGTKLDRTKLETLFATLPQEYRKDKAKLKFFTATDPQIHYISSLGNRVGEAADRRLTEGETVPKWGGIPVEDVPYFPMTEGVGGNQASMVLMDPKNAWLGFQRQVTFKHWEDPDAEQTVVNISVKLDFVIAFEPATAKYTKLYATA